MLHPEWVSQNRVVGVGDVADRVDVGVTRAEPGVGPDAVVDVESGSLGQLGGRLDTDADHEDVDVDRRPVSEPDGRAVSAGVDG